MEIILKNNGFKKNELCMKRNTRVSFFYIARKTEKMYKNK